MIYIKQELPASNNFSSPFHCFLDLETTGLSKNNDLIICFGLAYIKEETLYMEQYILEHKSEERDLLEQLKKILPTLEKIYTYGGKHFEWPFIIEKLNTYGIDSSFLSALQLIDLKQPKESRGALETRIGFRRNQAITGKELAKLSKLHLHEPNKTYETLILEHNKEELLSLQAIFDFTHFLNHLSPRQLKTYTFLEDSISFTLIPTKPYHLSFSFSKENIEYSFDSSTGVVTLSLKAQYLLLKTYLPHQDYYLVEGELMHKSIAKLLPTSMRQKATKSNCYLEQEGFYLPLQLKEFKDLTWVDEHKQSYISYKPEALEDYVLPLLKSVLKKITPKS